MKIILCHPGTQHSHYLAIQLNNNGFLLKFHTGIAFGSDHFVNKIAKFLPKKIRPLIDARIIKDLPDKKIRRNIFNEIKSIFNTKRNTNNEQVLYLRNKKFQEDINKKELAEADIVIGYDTSSWILASKCKDLGIPFILDVSIGHSISKNNIFEILSKKYPDWKSQVLIKDTKLINLEKQENELATMVVAPSSFVKNSFVENGIEDRKIAINPFGTDTSFFRYDEKKPDGKIKFLFYGGLTVRKGLPLLLSVWEKNSFENAELTIAGFGDLPINYNLPKNVFNRGKIVLSERENLFQEHHVFIFPSNFEGFAQVQIEAAASGLPIISTFNAGGTEIIKNGLNGVLIAPESETELELAISSFIKNPETITSMSKNQKRIIKDFTWDAYGKRWTNLINNINNNKCS